MSANPGGSRARPFLTARWESLLLLNYECPEALLRPLVPSGTELDLWDGRALISLVGFLFADTRVLGLAVPFHRTFEEVNLRFYVRRPGPDGEVRRGVVFIRELVPRRLVAAVARAVYNEPYLAVRMRREVRLSAERGGTVAYAWHHRGRRFELSARARGPAADSAPGSEAEFITEHYWGYSRQRGGGTVEYRVEHPRWKVWTAEEASFQGPAEQIYGPAFGEALASEPGSAFVADGSAVEVYRGTTLV